MPRRSVPDGTTPVMIRRALQTLDENFANSETGYTENDVTVSGDYQVLASDGIVIIDAASDLTITLPSLTGIRHKKLRFKRIDDTDYTVLVKGKSTAKIDGEESFQLVRQWSWLDIVALSTWYIFGKDDGLSAEAETDIKDLRIKSEDLNNQMLKQLKMMNLYLSLVTGDKINENEIED